MTNSFPTNLGSGSQLQDPVEIVKTDTDQLQEAENEGLAPIVPANPAVHQDIDPDPDPDPDADADSVN